MFFVSSCGVTTCPSRVFMFVCACICIWSFAHSWNKCPYLIYLCRSIRNTCMWNNMRLKYHASAILLGRTATATMCYHMWCVIALKVTTFLFDRMRVTLHTRHGRLYNMVHQVSLTESTWCVCKGRDHKSNVHLQKCPERDINITLC